MARISEIMRDSFAVEGIRYFVEQGGLKQLRAWAESILTDHHHAETGGLDHNKQLDRQHAIAALSYCVSGGALAQAMRHVERGSAVRRQPSVRQDQRLLKWGHADSPFAHPTAGQQEGMEASPGTIEAVG